MVGSHVPPPAACTRRFSEPSMSAATAERRLAGLAVGVPVHLVRESWPTTLVTGAALLTDYILTVAVSISAGVAQITSTSAR